MKKNSMVLLALCLICCSVQAQTSDFHFRKPLDNVTQDGWYSIALPADVLTSVRTDFSSLRIYQFNEKDTLEAPYVVRIRTDEVKDEIIELPMINKSTRDGKLYVTFELRKDQHVNYLELDTDERNFNGYVTLEGSPDQKEWFTIDSLQRILSIQKDSIDFKSTTLNFPVSNYAFLRLKIDVDHPIRVVTAAFRKRETKPGVMLTVPVRFSATTNRKSKQTIIDATLATLQPVSLLAIGIASTSDFYRPVFIESLLDSTKTPKGWNYNYATVYSGYIISGKGTRFDFPFLTTGKFRITIYNGDNAPLTVDAVEATGPEVDLIARLKTGTAYLYYGNNVISAPNYDIVHFEDKIPASAPALRTGVEENLLHPIVKRSPLFESKVWLWAAMGIVIALLGYFTLKMMKAKT